MLITTYDLGAFVLDGDERYQWMLQSGARKKLGSKSIRFPDSLLSFLYLDVDELEPIFRAIHDALLQLMLTHEQKHVDSIFAKLDRLAKRHVYFEEFSMDYKWRVSHAALHDDYTEEVLRVQMAGAMPVAIRRIQSQLLDLIEHVLDIDGERKPVRKKLAAFYRARGDEAFRFAQQPMCFELVDDETFVEVLHPNSIYDLIDYHVRECIRQETRMRRCKNCGRYFAIQIRSTAEYCDRVIDERGRTCKDVGAFTTWTQSKKDDTLFNDYRREYKKRFARTKVGKYTAEALYAWGAVARAKLKECKMGTITADEFREWMKNS